MSEFEVKRLEDKIAKYLICRRKIQKLLKREIKNEVQEEEIINYIVRLSDKAKLIEQQLKEGGVVQYGEDLSKWPTKRLRGFLI
jgi:hypothetical protein